MSKRTRKQKRKQRSTPLQQIKNNNGKTKGLPTLQETEDYIREHNLEVINPLSDFGFKRLLASERNKDILIHLLYAFISEDTGIITDVSYLPTELLGIKKEDKYVRFDLYCKNQDNDRFIVEMQNGKQQHYADRLRVYTSFATVQNLKPGDDKYEHVPRVYSFNMMSYNLQEFKGRENFFWKVCLKDDDNEIFTKNTAYYFVELSKFAAQLGTIDMGDERNRLLYMFTNVVYLPKKEINNLTPMQLRFYEECQITNFTDMEKQDYVKSLMEYPSVQEMVECERDEAKEEGIQIGIGLGIEQGIKRGLQQGLQQGLAQGRSELIHRMLENGLAPERVADITGIGLDEIQGMVC